MLCYLERLLPARSTPPRGTPSQGGGARDWSGAVRDVAPLLGLGMTLAATVLAGLGAGYWLDGQLGTRPAFLLVGSGIGIVAAMVNLFRSVSGAGKNRTDRKQ